MAVYVKVTVKCESDVRSEGDIGKRISKLKERLVREHSQGLFCQFEPVHSSNFWRTHELTQSHTLLACEYRSNGDVLFVFYRVFRNSDSGLRRLLRGLEKSEHLDEINPQIAVKWLQEIREAASDTEKRRPDELESAYLSSHMLSDHFGEGSFIESAYWVDRLATDAFRDYLFPLHELLHEIVLRGEKLGDREGPVLTPFYQRVAIIYRYLPEDRVWYLASPVRENEPEREAVVQRFLKELQGPLQFDTLRKRGRRSYPALVADDRDFWMRIQRSTLANLTLSPEETEILESVKGGRSDSPQYPLFINGRPGSGKSTILHYLFADHLHAHFKRESRLRLKHPPLYLTYGEPLMTRAKENVSEILRHGYHQLWEGPALELETLHEAFSTYRGLLRLYLSENMRPKFSERSYVNFARFRYLFEEFRRKHSRPDVRKLGPEVVWHTIRTYLKGYRSGKELTPEEYSRLPATQQSLTLRLYEQIFEQVWPWYQKSSSRGLWDDQDLTWAVLNSGVQLSRYPVVFCDEAQDFTRAELQVLQSLSLFSQLRLESFEWKLVPFAFAGDPFQTLNPTGFRWTTVKDNFYEVFKSKVEFNFRELSYNYRSAPGIVRFSNLIHLLRGVIFKNNEVTPQVPWNENAEAFPAYAAQDNPVFRDHLRQQEETVVIVPCQEGEEEAFVKDDPFLSTFAYGDGRVLRNILSPIRAKGLEFERVVVYGFGEFFRRFHQGLVALVNGECASCHDEQERLAFEYLVSQLYVAVSRPRKRLFIVDTAAALQEFWTFATDGSCLEKLLRRYDGWSRDDIRGLVSAQVESWSEDRDDPLRLAEELERNAIETLDWYSFQLAAQNYARAIRPEKSSLCLGYAKELRAEFAAAAAEFGRASYHEDAIRCLWRLGDWQGLLSYPNQSLRRDYRLAAELALHPGVTLWLELLPELRRRYLGYASEGEIKVDTMAIWRDFLGQQLARLVSTFEDKLRHFCETGEVTHCHSLDQLLNWIGESADLFDGLVQHAPLLALRGRYHDAINIWKKDEEPDWLLRSRAKVLGFPHNLFDLYRLQDFNAILCLHEQHDAWPDDPRARSAIIQAHLHLDRVDRLKDFFLRRVPDSEQLLLEMLQHQRKLKRQDWLAASVLELVHAHLKSREERNQVVDLLSRKALRNKQLQQLVEATGFNESERITRLHELYGGWPNEDSARMSILLAYLELDRLESLRILFNKDPQDWLLLQLIALLAERGQVEWLKANVPEMLLRLLTTSGPVVDRLLRYIGEAKLVNRDLDSPLAPGQLSWNDWHELFIRPLARYDGVVDLEVTNLRAILPALQVDSTQSHAVEEVGALLERVGELSKALNFYERYIDSDTDRQFARLRWLKCADRLLAIKKSSRLKRNFASRLETWGFNIVQVKDSPEVVVLEPVAWKVSAALPVAEEQASVQERSSAEVRVPARTFSPVSPPKQTPSEVWLLGRPFQVVVQPKKRRIQMTQDEDTLFISPTEGIRSDDVALVLEEGGWSIPKWQLRVCLVERGSESVVVFKDLEGTTLEELTLPGSA